MERIIKNILVVALIITLYCNIGWVVGNYYFHNVTAIETENLTTLGKVAAGGWGLFAKASNPQASDILDVIVIFGIAWPFGLAIVGISWMIYAGYLAGWFIIWGGGVKLLGLA